MGFFFVSIETKFIDISSVILSFAPPFFSSPSPHLHSIFRFLPRRYLQMNLFLKKSDLTVRTDRNSGNSGDLSADFFLKFSWDKAEECVWKSVEIPLNPLRSISCQIPQSLILSRSPASHKGKNSVCILFQEWKERKIGEPRRRH